MALHEFAGKPAPQYILENIPRLVSDYYTRQPDPEDPGQQVSFGTSGHRGSSSRCTFNEPHILAISQAIAEHRKAAGIDGPLYIGIDTHALSEPAQASALEVLVANGVPVRVARGLGYTPTPVISHAILTHQGDQADGVVITPSHNPPCDGGFKYNPPTGGPADTSTTKVIQDRANELLKAGLKGVQRVPLSKALNQVEEHDFMTPYISQLDQVIDMEVIAGSGLSIGVDPMGGAGIHFWEPIADHYKLKLEVVNPVVDPTFRFMTVDKDGKIRMDCSSPYAMASLIGLKDRFDIAFGNDTDFDRHGIVTPDGLMNPNHYLAVAIEYLLGNRPQWDPGLFIGKTLVSSSMIDRVVQSLNRKLAEVPVGFKWFVDGLLAGTYAFGGEESAGASFLRQDGSAWSTDKDGFILTLLAAEITARTGHSPSHHYRRLESRFGSPVYSRIDAPATREQKAILKALSPEQVSASELAGEAIQAKLTRAPGNDAAIGGLKIVTENGWVAARPSGTEDIYKIYAESFLGEDHLSRILAEAQELVDRTLSVTV